MIIIDDRYRSRVTFHAPGVKTKFHRISRTLKGKREGDGRWGKEGGGGNN